MSQQISVSPGVIHCDAAYEIREFQRRTRLSTRSLREAEANGLRIRRVNKKVRHVLGKDWWDFLANIGGE